MKSICSPAFLAEVADEFDIPSHARRRFGEAVTRASAVYKQSKAMSDDRPTLSEIQKNFELIEHRASSLLTLLEDMDDASWNYFWRAEQNIIDGAIDGRSSAMQEIGAFWQTDPLEDAWEFYTRDDAPPVLRLIRLICERARADMRAPSRGPKRRIALRTWVASVLDFWEGELGRPVTLDQSNPASSETYRFLERLLAPLVPSAVRQLPTALREERTRRRRGN